MNCNICKKKLDDTVIFCPYCGARQDHTKGTQIVEQEKYKKRIFPFLSVFFVVIALIGVLMIGLRDEFGEKLWEGRTTVYTGVNEYGVPYGNRYVGIGIEVDSEEDCCVFVRNVGILLLLTGTACAGTCFAMNQMKR